MASLDTLAAVRPRSPLAAEPPRLSLLAGRLRSVLVAMKFRPAIVSVGPLLGPIRTQFGLPHTAAALLTAIPDVLTAVLAVPAPGRACRFGRGRIILVSLVVILVETASRAFSSHVGMLFATTLLAGSGIAVAGALIGSGSAAPSRSA